MNKCSCMKLGSIAAYAIKGGRSHYWTDKPVEKSAINPRLPVEHQLTLTWRDQYGNKITETKTIEERPYYYFWMGADAYPIFQTIQRVSIE